MSLPGPRKHRSRAGSRKEEIVEPMPGPPTGTITFLFTDIEGSTRLWEEHPGEMQRALRRHDELLRQAVEGRNGHVFKTVGDAFCAAFPTALDALSAGLDAHLALQSEDWRAILGDAQSAIRIRESIHTGT